MKPIQLFKALATETDLSSRSDFLNRNEAYKWLTEAAQQDEWDSFNHILTDLMLDMRGPLFANYNLNDEEVIDYMISEIKNDLEINDCVFPFGQKLRKVEQVDRTRKKVFVLGVYSKCRACKVDRRRWKG